MKQKWRMKQKKRLREIEKSNTHLKTHICVARTGEANTYGSECCRKSLWQCSENYAFGTHKHTRLWIRAAQCNCANWLLTFDSRMCSWVCACVCVYLALQRLKVKQLLFRIVLLCFWSFVCYFVCHPDRLNGTTSTRRVYDFMLARCIFSRYIGT